MKWRYIRILIVTLIIAIAAIPALLRFAVNKPEPNEATIALSDAPYIYWYDDTADAIVIERADGTDSRYFAPNTQLVSHSPGILNWSVSGEWVTSFTYNAHSGAHLRISRTNGTTSLNLIPEDADVRYAEWSPTDDYLLVVYQFRLATAVVAIIDVPANTILAQMTLNGNLEAIYMPRNNYWLSDGSGVVVSQTLSPFTILIHLQTDGASTVYDGNAYKHYADGRLIAPHQVWNADTSTNEYPIIIHDLVTQEEGIIDENASPYNRYSANWNPTRTYALLYVNECIATSEMCTDNLYLLDWTSKSSINLSPHLNLLTSHEPPASVWSPHGRYLILGDEKDYPHIYDTQTNAEVAFTLEVENPQWAWTEDSTAILLMPTDAPVVVRFELATGEVSEQALALPTGSFNPIVSPNGRYLLPLGMMDGQLIDLETQESMLLPHHSNGAEAGRFADIIWHEDGEWFIASEIVSYTGGGGGPSSSTVYQLNGDVRRELGIEGAADFVPERAWRYLSAGQSESVVPEPEKQLHVGQNVWGVAWSPDGTQLVAYSSNNDSESQPQLTLWDVSGDTPQLTQRYETDFNCVPYPTACRIVWDAEGLTVHNFDTVQIWNMTTGEVVEEGNVRNVLGSVPPMPEYNDGILNITLNDMFVVHPSGEAQSFGTLSDFIFDTNTNMVITASIFDRSRLWDADTGNAATDLHILPIVARDLALSPDGTILAAASSNRVDLWAMDDLLSRIELSE